MVRGESYTFGIKFNDDFELTRLEELKLYIGAIEAGRLSNRTIKYQDGYYRAELNGITTNKLALGSNIIKLYIDDRRRGILKPTVGTITITDTPSDTDCSVNTGFNSIINIKLDESGLTTDLVLLNAVRGKSAYEYAIDQGYIGTETQFAEDLAVVGNKVDYFEIGDSNEALAFEAYQARGGFAKLTLPINVYYQGNKIGSIDANLASLEKLNNGKLVLKTNDYLEMGSGNPENLVAWVSLSIIEDELAATVSSFIAVGDELDKVKYEGATRDLDLGSNSIKAASVIYTEAEPEVKVPLQRYYSEENQTTMFIRPDGSETNDNQEVGGIYTNVDSVPLEEKMLVSAVPLAGNRKGMARLDISSKTSVENFLGMVTVPVIPVNQKGLVTFLGEVDSDTFGLAENSVIYAGVTKGSWSTTPPPKGYYHIHIGTVVVSALQGKVNVKPYVLPKFNDLSDVNNNAVVNQPLVKKSDGTWGSSEVIKTNRLEPISGYKVDLKPYELEAQGLTAQTANIPSIISLGGNGIQSQQGFKKISRTDNDILLAGGGHIPITELKAGIHVLTNPSNTSQVVVEVNAAGDILLKGNIIIDGEAYELQAEKVSTTEQYIELRRGAEQGLPIDQYSGFIIKKYDGVNDALLALGRDGVMRLGDIGDTQAVMTRDDILDNHSFVFFDTVSLKAKTTSNLEPHGTPEDSHRIPMIADQPGYHTWGDLKQDAKDAVEKELIFYISHDDISVVLGIGEAAIVTTEYEGYPSITIELPTL